MITPQDIETKEFSKGVRGYKEEEVDAFLDLIILDLEKLLKENAQLKKELEKAEQQLERHVSTEGAVYDTLESAKALMNDIAASAERRAQVILKDAELEAALITREAKESVSKLTEEGNRLRRSVERVREKYRQMLELELERMDLIGHDFFAEFEGDFLPASISDLEQLTQDTKTEPSADSKKTTVLEKTAELPRQEKEIDLSKTMMNIR